MIQVFFFLISAITIANCVSFESPSKQDNSMIDKINSLRFIKLQKDISVHYIVLKSRRSLLFTKSQFQFQIYYTPQMYEFIPTENNQTDYTTFLQDVDIDMAQQQPIQPQDYAINQQIEYKISNHTKYVLEETLVFSGSRQESLYKLNDFLNPNELANNQTSLNIDKLIDFLRNKNQIEGNTNSIFIIVNSDLTQDQNEFNLTQYISNDRKEQFLYGFLDDLKFKLGVKEINELIQKAYMNVKQNIIHEQRLYCLKQYMKSVEKIQSKIIQDIEAGAQLLSPSTKLSDIFELEEYFQFQSIWAEIVLKYELFFQLLNMNKFKKTTETLRHVTEYFNDQMVTFLTNSLTKEDVEQDQNYILMLLQQYTFSILLLFILIIFIYIYIKKSKVFDLFGKKFV